MRTFHRDPSEASLRHPSDAASSPVPPGANGVEARAVPRRRRGRVIGILVFVALGGLVLGVLGATVKVKGGDRLSADPQGPAPDFTRPLLEGDGSITLSDLRGHPVLLNFWASWCGPCKEEAPILADGWRRWRDSGVIFLGVNTRDSRSAAIAFDERYGIEYQSVVDQNEQVNYAYGVTGFPESFFIDADGVIVAKYVGAMDAETLDAYVSLLVDGS
ncbi:MAG TPA: TlpA disulfide reductase family protein [Actinomycetota bacterium]|jgi:cytochrome c biogenesis protein CcmG/thiol:disulfide interchange protein DsbE|nr:TlpA disulfide reductase family protein [Actinomycetota bacterium]